MSIAREKYSSKPRPIPNNCPTTVRIARKADAAELYDLIMNGVVKDTSIAPPNEMKVAEMVNAVLAPAVSANQPRPVVAVIDAPNGKIAAAAPILPAQWWYSNDYYLYQPWIYVREAYRKQPHSRTLIETVTWWSERVGLPMLMAAPSGDDFSDRRQVYSRYGKPFGGTFVHSGGLGVPTPKPRNVRVATVNDYPVVKALLLKMAEESAMASVSNKKLDDMIMLTLTQSRGIVGLATDEFNNVVGLIGLIMVQWDYSLAWSYKDFAMFVSPDHRKGKYAVDLINFTKWWAEQTGIPVNIGVASKSRTRAKIRFYSQHLRPLEVTFMHETEGA